MGAVNRYLISTAAAETQRTECHVVNDCRLFPFVSICFSYFCFRSLQLQLSRILTYPTWISPIQTFEYLITGKPSVRYWKTVFSSEVESTDMISEGSVNSGSVVLILWPRRKWAERYRISHLPTTRRVCRENIETGRKCISQTLVPRSSGGRGPIKGSSISPNCLFNSTSRRREKKIFSSFEKYRNARLQYLRMRRISYNGDFVPRYM